MSAAANDSVNTLIFVFPDQSNIDKQSLCQNQVQKDNLKFKIIHFHQQPSVYIVDSKIQSKTKKVFLSFDPFPL